MRQVASGAAGSTFRLGQALTAARHRHSIDTREYARSLGRRWGVDAAKCALAGLLHDCARDIAPLELLKTARSSGILVDAMEACHPVLLHGRVGAVVARREYGVTDDEVLRALETHPTGEADMGPVARVLYVADHAEPGRRYPGVEELRRLAEVDLDHALLRAMDATQDYLRAQGLAPHPRALSARAAVAARLRGQAAAPR